VEKLTLKIRPVKLKQSVYFRVPNDIADLIGIDSNAQVTLNLEEQDEKFLLIYSVTKTPEIVTQPRRSRIQHEKARAADALPPIHVERVANPEGDV
jgi:hypothetical protein